MHSYKLLDSLRNTDQNKHSVIIATLLFRLIRSDGEAKMLELLHMSEILRKDFSLSQDELENVFEMANAAKDNDPVELLNQVRDNLEARSRSNLLKYLWILAFADDKIDDKEVQLISEIAKQLGLSDLDQIRCQQRAEEHLGL